MTPPVKIWGFLAGCAFAGIAGTSWGDNLLLRDGKSLDGRITGETPETVTIETAAGRFTFSRTQIASISRESAAENQRREMEQYLAQGKIDTAMMVYRNTELANTLSDTDLVNMFVAQLRNTAAGAVATSATTTDLVRRLQAHPNAPAELFVLTATFVAEHEEPSTALSLLKQAEGKVTGQFLWPPETVLPLLERIANAATKTSDGALLGATAALAARLPAPGDQQKQNQLVIYSQIESYLRQGDFLRAAALFHPDYFLHRADLFVPLAERLITSVLANASANTAMPALEAATATILPYIDPQLRLQAYKTMVTRLFDSGRVNEAQAVADKVSASAPDTGAILEHLVEFRRRHQDLQKDSAVATYKLASWAKKMGLLDEAEGLFLTLRSDPRFTETVNLQLEVIDHQQSADAVRRLRAIYDRSDFEKLNQEAAAFLKTSPPDQFAQEARNLLQLADFEQWSKKHNLHDQAEAEFQHAERLANRGEYDAALSHLNQIQLDRKDSAAALKADSLRDRIMREKLKQNAKAAERATTTPGSAP